MDLRSGMTLCFAVLTALHARRRTGVGQHIDLSSRESITCLTGHELLHYTMNGESPQRQGNDDAFLAPHGCYRCQGDDRWVTLAVGSEVEWQALCRAVDHPEWLADARFVDAESRVRNREPLDALLNAWTAQRTQDAVTSTLQHAGVAAYPTMDSATLAASEHLRARAACITVEHAILGPQTVLGPPWRSADVPPTPDRPGPLLGEHTEPVLRDLLGLSDPEIARLRQVGALE
jgi:benzylsuccinate CoA-transferase BbsF subunit